MHAHMHVYKHEPLNITCSANSLPFQKKHTHKWAAPPDSPRPTWAPGRASLRGAVAPHIEMRWRSLNNLLAAHNAAIAYALHYVQDCSPRMSWPKASGRAYDGPHAPRLRAHTLRMNTHRISSAGRDPECRPDVALEQHTPSQQRAVRTNLCEQAGDGSE